MKNFTFRFQLTSSTRSSVLLLLFKVQFKGIDLNSARYTAFTIVSLCGKVLSLKIFLAAVMQNIFFLFIVHTSETCPEILQYIFSCSRPADFSSNCHFIIFHGYWATSDLARLQFEKAGVLPLYLLIYWFDLFLFFPSVQSPQSIHISPSWFSLLPFGVPLSWHLSQTWVLSAIWLCLPW